MAVTEGNARDCASYFTTYGARREFATHWARRRARGPLPGRADAARVIAAALLAALAAVALWPSPTGVAGAGLASVAGAPAGASLRLQRLPVPAQAAISTALGAGRATSDARATRSGYSLAGGGVAAQLGRRGVSLSGAGGAVSLALTSVGRPGAMRTVGPAPPAAHANRVTYRHGDVAEWYAGGPLGVEQGYTLARPPHGAAGPLVLSTAVHGSLQVRPAGRGLEFTTRSGVVALRYGGLEAVDSAGRRLSATLALHGGHVLIRVDDRHARYPVTIDPFVQQGQKLTANDTTFPDRDVQGVSVAVSQDGNSVLVGGPGEGAAGAAWVFVNVGGVWTQQGGKLAPNNASLPSPSGSPLFGDAVALSADGNVALIGAPFDQNAGPTVPEAGAAWVFFRSGSSWSQGPKLIPNNPVVIPNDHGSLFGSSVALSGDGNTAVIGGWGDNGFAGAAWVFTTGGTQLQKLNPPGDATAFPAFAKALALSEDGSTAVIAGPDQGAVWAYTRSGGTYVQQSNKLTPRDGNANGGSSFGSAVALSANGNTTLIGGSSDSNQNGAAWVFTRSGTSWAQQGPKLQPSDETNAPSGGGFGTSVALSADGNSALIGAPSDFGSNGAAWMFVRSGTSWSQRGAKLAVNTVAGGEQGPGGFGSAVGLSGDGIRALISAPEDNNVFGAVWAFNQVPQCTNQAATAPPGGGAVSISLSCTGPVGQPIAFAIATGPGHGGVGSINQATGTISYVSQPGFAGTDTFTYVAGDAGGSSQPATVTITVPPAAPSCSATSATTAAGGGAVPVKLSCTGPPGVAIQYGVVAGPHHGTLSALNQGAGSVVYTPAPGFHGTDTFTYHAVDAGGASAPATATVTVPPGPPVCADIASSTAGEGQALTVQLSCSGPAGVKLTYAIASKPGHGTLGAIDQKQHAVRYTPHIGYHGRDRFTYTATNAGGRSRRATATITVPKPQGSLAFAFLAWNFSGLSTGTQVLTMTGTGLFPGTRIAASCHGHGCRLNMAPVVITSTTTCPRQQHRCKHKTRPHTRSVDLTPRLRGTRFPVGSRLVITLTKPGFIGKVYTFTMRANRQPASRATCLAPGSLVPGKGC